MTGLVRGSGSWGSGDAGVVSTSRVGKQLLCTLALPEVKTACELIRNVLRKQVDEGRKLVV